MKAFSTSVVVYILVFIAVFGAALFKNFTEPEQKMVIVVVAKEDIEPGKKITKEMLEPIEFPEEYSHKRMAPTISMVVGSSAVSMLPKGLPILTTSLVPDKRFSDIFKAVYGLIEPVHIEALNALEPTPDEIKSVIMRISYGYGNDSPQQRDQIKARLDKALADPRVTFMSRSDE